jgi:dienelactone hydrolase
MLQIQFVKLEIEMKKLCLILTLLIMVLTPNAFAGWGDKSTTIKFATKDLGDFPDVLDGIENGKDIEIYGKFTIPKEAPKEGKIPCMIYVHGSGGGFTKSAIARIDPWLEMFHDMGIATFKLNCFKARGVKSTAKKQLDVTTGEMVVDAFKALEVMANHPRIDKNRIGIIGESKGGSVSLYTHWKPFLNVMNTKEKFALHISLYAMANDFKPFEFTDAPILSLVGEKDNWVPPETWIPLIQSFKDHGHDAEVVVYKGAYHAFDASYSLQHIKHADSYTDCRVVMFEDGRMLETTTGLYDREGLDKCKNSTSGAKVGSNSAANKASKIKAAEFVTRVFHLEIPTEKVVKKTDNNSDSTDR